MCSILHLKKQRRSESSVSQADDVVAFASSHLQVMALQHMLNYESRAEEKKIRNNSLATNRTSLSINSFAGIHAMLMMVVSCVWWCSLWRHRRAQNSAGSRGPDAHTLSLTGALRPKCIRVLLAVINFCAATTPRTQGLGFVAWVSLHSTTI